MAESWRSCPEVLTLVNQVFGDHTTLKDLFGEAAKRWEWQNHFPAKPLEDPQKRGHARVEIVGDWDERLERLAGLLHELGVGQRAMTCGILLRGNDKARQVADELRARGFDVIEEGRREPGKDNPIGIVITNLLKWLADPGDSFARGVVEMSPLADVLSVSYGTSWRAIWATLTTEVSQSGFAETIHRQIRDCWADWSDFGRRRAGDLLAGLADLDHQGGISAGEAAAWMERLELSQSPGVAAVQVMTIHKAKGLGFDVVILPEIPDDIIPQAQHFDVAEGDGWLTQTPPKWSRAIIPELRYAEIQWSIKQQYEAFCMLYVALTRAKRGFYVMLDRPAKSANPDKPSLANWLARSLGRTDETVSTDVLHETDNSMWTATLPPLEPSSKPGFQSMPASRTLRRPHENPSQASTAKSKPAHSHFGAKFGSSVHAILEHVGWVDETLPELPDNDAGHAVARLIKNPDLQHIFERAGRNIDLFNEQATDIIQDGSLCSGVIDRLHLHRGPNGQLLRVEIIDFKTDVVETPTELAKLYSAQMGAYRQAIQKVYPEVERIDCILVSVNHGTAVFA